MAAKKYNKPNAIPNWRIFISLVNLLVFLLVMSFSYLLLEDTIVEWMNREPLPVGDLQRKTKSSNKEEDWNRVVNGIHVRTGLHDDPNLQTIIGACTSCHSAKMITQNKATRDGWEQMIRWMQKTQNLGDLGKSEPIILDYLAM